MKHDQYLHKLNNGLRVSVHDFVINKNQSASDAIKEQLKELEENGLLEDLKSNAFNQFGVLQAMLACYIEPAQKLVNKNFKAALNTIMDHSGIQSFSSFQKGEVAEASGAAHT